MIFSMFTELYSHHHHWIIYINIYIKKKFQKNSEKKITEEGKV